MDTNQIISLARKYATDTAALMASSARFCLTDAIALADAGDLISAQKRAVKSLAYSVGVFHNDYKRANQAFITNRARVQS
jgi:hypothetical protein